MHQRNSSSSVSDGALGQRGRDLEVVLGQLARHRVHGDVGERAVAHQDRARPRSSRCSRPAGAGSRPCGRRRTGSRRRRSGRCRRCGTTSCGWSRPSPRAGPSSPRTSLCGRFGRSTISPSVPRGSSLSSSSKMRTSKYSSLIDAGGVRLVAHARRLPRDEAGLGHAVGAAERVDAEALAQDRVDLDRQRRRADQAQRRVGLGRARPRHLGPVDVVGEQVGHRARAST